MGVLRGAFFLALLVAAVGFSVLNDQPVSLQYYFGWVSLSLRMERVEGVTLTRSSMRHPATQIIC